MTKGNDGTGNTIERDEWQTPQRLWNQLNKQYNFDLDACAKKSNRKVEDYTPHFEKFPNISCFNCVWMNPPFSKAKQMFVTFVHSVKSGVCIYRCDNMETAVWQEVILPNASWIAIPKGRISYEGFESKGSRFPSALIGFNVEEPKLKDWNVLHVKGS